MYDFRGAAMPPFLRQERVIPAGILYNCGYASIDSLNNINLRSAPD